MNARPMPMPNYSFRLPAKQRARFDMLEAVFLALLIGSWASAYCLTNPPEPMPAHHVAVQL